MNNRSTLHVPPSAPTDLVGVAIGSCQVIVAWNESGTGGLGFRIERAAGGNPGSPFAEIGEVGPHVTAFHDETVKPRMTYSYRVHAWNASGDSSPSNVAEVETPQAGPEPASDKV